MKQSILLPFIAFLFLLPITSMAQESNYLNQNDTIQVFDVLEVNGEFRKSLRLLDFLRKDSRFSNRQLAKLADRQVVNFSSAAVDREPGRSIPFLYLDGELIVADGMNRLYLIDQLRMSDIKTIATKRRGFEKVVYITTLDKDKKKNR